MHLTDVKKIAEKNILVTGTTGLIGSTLIKELLQWNAKEKLNLRILAIIRSMDKAQMIFRDYCNWPDTVKFFLGGGWSNSLT